MASKIQFSEVLQQINDDSDWCDSDDDLIEDEQVGDVESFSYPIADDPLDKVHGSRNGGGRRHFKYF